MNKDTAYASGFVSLKMQELLDASRLDRMIYAEDIEDALSVLLECGYDSDILKSSPIDSELLLDNQLQSVVQFFEDFCTDGNLRLAVLKRYDYHNAKVLMKSKLSGRAFDSALYPIGLIGKDALLEAITEDEFDKLPVKMAEAIRGLETSQAQRLSSREIDITLDKAMYSDIAANYRKIKSKRIRDWFVLSADFCNILIVLRSVRLAFSDDEIESQFVEGGSISRDSLMVLSEGKFSEVSAEFASNRFSDLIEKLFLSSTEGNGINEDEISKILANICDEGILNIFSDEPLFSWYQKKLAEIKTVRMIAFCKRSNMSANDIKNRLRGFL